MSVTIDIPLSEGVPLPYFDMTTALEGVVYTLQFRWNVRASAWYMDVLDEIGATVKIPGIKLVTSWPLAAYKAHREPPGVFVVTDTLGTVNDPGIADLGVRHILTYFSSSEIGGG